MNSGGGARARVRVLQCDSQEGVVEANLGSHWSVAMIPPRLRTSIQIRFVGCGLQSPLFFLDFCVSHGGGADCC